MPLKREEVGRKVLHIFSGTVIPAGIFYIPQYSGRLSWTPEKIPGWVYPAIILGLVFLVFFTVEFLRFRVGAVQELFKKYFGYMLRSEESKKTTGATHIVASGFLCSVLFRSYPHISAMVICMFIWGDAVAALAGQSFGRIRVGKKSVEGSLACFLLCLFTCYVIFPYVPGLLDVWDGRIPHVLAFSSSLLITLLELVPLRISKTMTINDNLFVPVVAGYVMILLQRI